MDLSDRQTTTAPPQLSASEGVQISLGAIARPLAVGAWLSAVLGRGLAPALRGTSDGLGGWIAATGLVGAALTQLTAILGATFGALLMLTALWQRRFPYAYRLAAMPTGAAVLTLVALSTRQTLAPAESLALAGCATILAGASAAVSLSTPQTRAVGLVLSLVTGAAASFSSARGLGWIDTVLRQDDWHGWATGLATAGWSLDVLGLVLATAVLTTRRGPIVRGLAAASLLSAGAFAFLAGRGALDGAAFAEVLAYRVLSEVLTGPAPSVPTVFRFFAECYAMVLAALLIATGRRVATAQIALALLVLCRASPEIPLCALLLVIASVLAPLGTRAASSHESVPTGIHA